MSIRQVMYYSTERMNDHTLDQPVGCQMRHRGCRSCSGDYKPSEEPDTTASLNCNAGTGQCIQAERTEPAAGVETSDNTTT